MTKIVTHDTLLDKLHLDNGIYHHTLHWLCEKNVVLKD